MKSFIVSLSLFTAVFCSAEAFAVRLILPGELSKHAISEGTRPTPPPPPPKTTTVQTAPKK